MEKSRVEKYAEHRKQIEKDLSVEENSPLENEIHERNKQRGTGTLDDVMAKADEYTVLIDNAEVAERKLIEDKRKKQQRKNKIITISIFILLGIIVIVLISAIIAIISSIVG